MPSLHERTVAVERLAQSLSTPTEELCQLAIMALLLVAQVVLLAFALGAVLMLSPVLAMTPVLARVSHFTQNKMRSFGLLRKD